MLKRYQVLLKDYLAEYIQYIGREYDLSFSETIRVALSLHFCEVISGMYPKKTFGVDTKEMTKAVKQSREHPEDLENLHKLISQAYFEARKAIEYRMTDVTKKDQDLVPKKKKKNVRKKKTGRKKQSS
ncbi:MAG: hypothetical protein GF333_03310 [Candidatus Omnitrophica bacterium]|nr:hypothetical protein [Candidatus Omnitrophota bacterium]